MTSRNVHHEAEGSSNLIKHDKHEDKWTIKPRALNIVWGKDPRYWRLSEEEGPAHLLQVSWLEVTGKLSLDRLKKNREYTVKFKVELSPDHFGWEESPVYFMVRVGGEDRVWRKAYIGAHARSRPGEEFEVPATDRPLKFEVPAMLGTGEKLEFGMYEIWRGRWKGGLVIREVIIQPVANI
ncbi:Phloem protein 2-like A9 [Apostasia shenzhenica]|uniref:Phloem protein 2-like A9 n=1 Tax=Apostasia shenzhenica TaxID=1088818 RepID=A0A2I0AKI3_9ASPA|nr:Phloem protein 2-like A9 [Apostasia shenzhenica]